jgi:hypothetical protein
LLFTNPKLFLQVEFFSGISLIEYCPFERIPPILSNSSIEGKIPYLRSGLMLSLSSSKVLSLANVDLVVDTVSRFIDDSIHN